MSAWIKMRVDLVDDPAVVSVATTLGVDEDLVVGKLHRLWSWADRQTTDGKAAGVTAAWVDRFVYQPGFADALVAAGWLKITPAGVSFPNFDRHNGKSAKARAEAAERKRVSRENCDSVTKMSRKKCDTVTKKCDQIREEKRREEENPPNPPAGGTAFPAGLDREDFRKAWADLLAYRAEQKFRPFKPRTVAAKFAEFQAWGVDRAIQACRASIANGWQGVFEPKNGVSSPLFAQPPSPPKAKDPHAERRPLAARWYLDLPPERQSEISDTRRDADLDMARRNTCADYVLFAYRDAIKGVAS